MQTEKKIQETFLKLARQKPADKITVKEIVEACGINRNSFYYHFEDIPDLASSILEDRVQEIMDTYTNLQVSQYMLIFAERLQESHDFWKNVYFSKNRNVLDYKLMQVIEKSVRQYLEKNAFLQYPDVSAFDREVVVSAYKAEIVGFVMEWLKNGMDIEVQEKIRRMIDLRVGTLERMLEKAQQDNAKNNRNNE